MNRCDLILLSWNRPECTVSCVESILQNTTLPCRLILIDQDSDEPTRAALKKLTGNRSVSMETIWNPTNVGYAQGMNQGLSLSSAPHVCFLNNDILVTPGWLEELLRIAESNPAIGAVNPSSNTFDIYPPKGSNPLKLAQRLRQKHAGRWVEVHYAEGFCLLAQTDLMKKLGGFDAETYSRIYFEDADLGRRLQKLGYRCVMAKGTYVWHEGGQSAKLLPERLELFAENERRFQAKWGKGRRVLYAIAQSSPEAVRQAAAAARQEANRSSDVWLFLRGRPPLKTLPQHLNIRLRRCPPGFFLLAVLWKVLTKKKPLDRIVTDSPTLRRILNGTRGVVGRQRFELCSPD